MMWDTWDAWDRRVTGGMSGTGGMVGMGQQAFPNPAPPELE